MKSTFLVAACVGSAYGIHIVKLAQFMKKNIDPLVFPGAYRSHMHCFFGSPAVTVNTTTSDQISEGGCTTATNLNDLSVYWVPELYTNIGGKLTEVPVYLQAYYINIDKAEIPIPENFHAIAGNSKATSNAETVSGSNIRIGCEDEQPSDRGVFPQKPCKGPMQTLLYFPDCVDTQTLKSVYARDNGWKCPSGYKRIPQLRFSARYDLNKAIPGGWSGTPPLQYSCGPSYCWHGDFINGWLPEAAKNMLRATHATKHEGVPGPNDSKVRGKNFCRVEDAHDADPDRGTSDLAKSMQILKSYSP
ncbi:hypothetical protein BDZ85DRAFT_20118 [Elsinoe ampelina]|uniref:DUF1996 domain-containing protein n=1 Tax=Elsinoe ampelina TaxID=302913 RepID=A0A6A6G5J5_9PEZI|nr:hypothetical protein BDZ85DRAFT_20118 [Elsinoe ampelina]